MIEGRHNTTLLEFFKIEGVTTNEEVYAWLMETSKLIPKLLPGMSLEVDFTNTGGVTCPLRVKLVSTEIKLHKNTHVDCYTLNILGCGGCPNGFRSHAFDELVSVMEINTDLTTEVGYAISEPVDLTTPSIFKESKDSVYLFRDVMLAFRKEFGQEKLH